MDELLKEINTLKELNQINNEIIENYKKRIEIQNEIITILKEQIEMYKELIGTITGDDGR